MNAMKRYLSFLVIVVTSQVLGIQPPGQRPVQRGVSEGEHKISGRLRYELAARLPEEALKVWVYLADKGDDDLAGQATSLSAAEDHLSPRARRRLSLRSAGPAGWEDLPVHTPYIARIEEAGGQIDQLSRWLNAASVISTPEVIRRMADLPFVQGIEEVARLRHPRPGPPEASGRTAAEARFRAIRPARLDYGPSRVQLDQLQVPELHDLGLTGQGVLVAVFDTGFSLDHVALDSLETRVEARRNFLRDETGFTELEDSGHGTAVLGTIGGHAPGQLVGPAYGASYLLASTEVVAFENQIEEDFWVAALEWADSLGVDVISNSLGYSDWYAYADMDGETAVVTRAAATAVRRGIVIVTAMGNMGGEPYEKMPAPADAEGVISVGAVDAAGRRAGFSSVGPTYDGRIKPDVMAMGEGVYMVDHLTMDAYRRNDGTSFSTPLVAGVAALLLEAYPHWTPLKIQQVLRSTASQAAAPDTLNGYGIVQALDALRSESPGTVRSATAPVAILYPNAPNPFDASTSIGFELTVPAQVTLTIYNLLGRRVRVLVNDTYSPGRYNRSWNGNDDDGRSAPSGVYLYRLTAGDFEENGKMLLLR